MLRSDNNAQCKQREPPFTYTYLVLILNSKIAATILTYLLDQQNALKSRFLWPESIKTNDMY
jgi:hypothetical protein